MKITNNFTLAELTTTSRGLTNNPNRQEFAALIRLCGKVLQPARDLYGASVYINSGFRSLAVNRAVGGVRNSQHTFGEAADITVHSREGNKRLFEVIRDNLCFDQLINEKKFSWIHVSYKSEEENKKQVLHL